MTTFRHTFALFHPWKRSSGREAPDAAGIPVRSCRAGRLLQFCAMDLTETAWVTGAAAAGGTGGQAVAQMAGGSAQPPSGGESELAVAAATEIRQLLPADLLAFMPGEFLYIDATEVMIRLVAALVAGIVLGLDREIRHRPAGVRTYMLVSVGAAVYSIVTMEVVMEMRAAGAAADPTRITQGLIGGIGFLGAGAIIQSRGQIGGLSTAASIWVAGGVGMACGFGYYSHAFIVAVITALILTLSFFIEGRGEGYQQDRPPRDRGDRREDERTGAGPLAGSGAAVDAAQGRNDDEEADGKTLARTVAQRTSASS